MLDKTLLDNEDWHVSISMLGFGSIHFSDHKGNTFTATPDEKRFILDSLVALDRRRLPLEVFIPVRLGIISDFAAAIFEQRNDRAHSGYVYNLTFGGAPGSQLDEYLNNYYGQ